jgi:hypothetical protein
MAVIRFIVQALGWKFYHLIAEILKCGYKPTLVVQNQFVSNRECFERSTCTIRKTFFQYLFVICPKFFK